MVAKYKQKRLAEEWSSDSSKGYEFEGSERGRGKREARQGLVDNDEQSRDAIARELADEREMKMAIDCWEREKADPNYRCNCFGEDVELTSEHIKIINNTDLSNGKNVQCSENIQCSQNTEQNVKPRKLSVRTSFALFLADYKASRNR